MALAFAAFLSFFRFEIGVLPIRAVAGLAPTAALVGAGAGVVMGRAARRKAGATWLLGLASAALWTWWGAAQPGGPWPLTAALTVAGFGLLSGFIVAAWPAAGGAASLVLGAVAGFALCAAGLMGVMGIAPAVLGGVALAALGGLATTARSAASDLQGAATGASHGAARLLLAAAVGAAAVGLLRAYVPAARSLAYAASDLGIGFAAGVLLFGTALRQHVRSAGLLALATVGAAAIAVLCGLSFFLYPDLVMSDSAAMQTPASLLVPGRVFPLWVMAFVLGLAAGPAWCSVGGGPALAAALLASATGAAGASLVAGVYGAAYVLPVGLALLAAGALCLSRRARGSEAEATLSVGALVLCALAGVWCLTAGPDFGWAGLARTLRDYMSSTPERRAEAGPVSMASARLTPAGLSAVLAAPKARAEFCDGNLTSVVRAGGGFDRESAPLTMSAGLGLAFSSAPARIGSVEPSLDIMARTIERLSGGDGARQLSVWGPDDGGRFDVVVCGPGPFSAAGNPLAVLSREGLARLRTRLTPGGVLCLWFPAGRVGLSTLEDALATFREVFPSFCVFMSGEEAVFMAVSAEGASAAQGLPFARLKELRGPLAAAGLSSPLDLLEGFVADAGELAPLTDAGSPFRLSHPRRPPVLARNLTDKRRLVSVAALLQYRQSGPDRILARITFESDAQRAVALRGFADTYGDETWRALQSFALSDAWDRRELLRFLDTPLARLDLFAPKEEGRVAGTAAALYAFGLREAAAGVLKRAIEQGQGTFAVHCRLAAVLEDLGRGDEALSEYRKALSLSPGSAEARGRMISLLLSMGRNRDAADALRQVIQKEPENVPALLMLARLCAGPLNRPGEAADLAARVLRIEPQNAAAQDVLMLCRKEAAPAR